MKNIFLILSIASFLSSFSQKKTVKLKMTQYIPYCGGAKPSPEITTKLNAPVPYANKTLIYVSDKNKIDSVKTNAKGVLNLKLSYGSYKFFEPWKYYRQIPYGEKESNINMECLALEWEIADMKITVGKKIVYDEYKLLYPICSYRFPCLINKHFPQ
jgi:hypothetical protein